jgi:short-subunit dehydrogenase
MYGPKIKVSCLCPQGVTTNMLLSPDVGPATEYLRAEAITAEEVAEAVVQGIAEEKFLILPHPVVSGYFMRKASDYDRWIRGMRRLQEKIDAMAGKK